MITDHFCVSGSVMDLLCGPWGGALCSPQRLLDYLGSISNGYAPFQINYLLYKELDSGSSIKPHDPPVVPCNEEPLPGKLSAIICFSQRKNYLLKSGLEKSLINWALRSNSATWIAYLFRSCVFTNSTFQDWIFQ